MARSEHTAAGDAAPQPRPNEDAFHVWPVRHLVGVLPDPARLDELVEQLRAAGVDVASLTVLVGQAGVDVLDRRGHRHGLRARVVRAVQALGDDQNDFGLYDAALHSGQVLVEVPASAAGADALARVLQGCALEHVAYYGRGSLRTFPPAPRAPGGR